MSVNYSLGCITLEDKVWYRYLSARMSSPQPLLYFNENEGDKDKNQDIYPVVAALVIHKTYLAKT
jgi:hypothetical protein